MSSLPPTRDQATEDRIAAIAKMMTTPNGWHAGKSHRRLAAKWGVSPSRVRQLATEASHWLRTLFEPEQREEHRARILARLEATRDVAMRRTKVIPVGDGGIVERPDPDVRAAREIDELELKTLGLVVERHEVKVAPLELGEAAQQAAEMLCEDHIDTLRAALERRGYRLIEPVTAEALPEVTE